MSNYEVDGFGVARLTIGGKLGRFELPLNPLEVFMFDLSDTEQFRVISLDDLADDDDVTDVQSDVINEALDVISGDVSESFASISGPELFLCLSEQLDVWDDDGLYVGDVIAVWINGSSRLEILFDPDGDSYWRASIEGADETTFGEFDPDDPMTAFRHLI